MAESNGWLSEEQAGFRANRPCEDILISLTQHISDVFQSRERTVLAELDCSKAFDRVSHQKLIITHNNTGVPLHHSRLINSFLTNGLSRVSYNGELRRPRRFHHGLPQGSVLSPIPFIRYTYDITRVIPPHAEILLYAYDMSIWATHRKKEQLHRTSNLH